MKWLIVGMRKQFVEGFIKWMRENNIQVDVAVESDSICRIMYKPIGKKQREMCEQYIEYCCHNSLL